MSKQILVVKVSPNASKNEVMGYENNFLKIKIRAIPDKGKANEALIFFLADYLKIAKSQITIISGHKSPIKKLEIVDFQNNLKDYFK